MITAKVIADSVSRQGARLTTMLVTYPRFIHAEHLRHRMFSFCVASSRAIPAKKFAKLVRQQPAVPVWWGKNQSGMKAREELSGFRLRAAQAGWWLAKQLMLMCHFMLRTIGLHKQLCNRLLEPWMPVTVLVTGTEWLNFFKLRCHKDAQPEFQALADAMLHAYVNSAPQLVREGEWHLPFLDTHIDRSWPLDVKKKVSTSRAARLSYMTHDGSCCLEKDLVLHDDLKEAGHWSPFEHVATPDPHSGSEFHGNFKGWLQYRKGFHRETWDSVNVNLRQLLRERQEAGSVYALGPSAFKHVPPWYHERG